MPKVIDVSKSMAEKILLDTDIGSDIDDALCLAYLLANPACELMGITTVTGEARQRAMLASAVCKAAGKEIPIFPGAETPLLIHQQQDEAPQAEALARLEHEETFPQGRALAFMQEIIYRHPGEITLLTIGPLTNIALLFASDSRIPGMLKQLVMMSGLFFKRLGRIVPLEWNVQLDPHAAAMVYKHDVADHISIGADVTHRVKMGRDQVRRRFQVPLLEKLAPLIDGWLEDHESIIFHDPLAAISIFDSGVCQLEKGEVEIELSASPLRGFTYWTPFPLGQDRRRVAVDVDPERFFRSFFEVFH